MTVWKRANDYLTGVDVQLENTIEPEYNSFFAEISNRFADLSARLDQILHYMFFGEGWPWTKGILVAYCALIAVAFIAVVIQEEIIPWWEKSSWRQVVVVACYPFLWVIPVVLLAGWIFLVDKLSGGSL